MKQQIRTAPQLANALRTAVNKKIAGSGYSLEEIDDGIDYATSDILDGDNCSCGQIYIDDEDLGLTCNIAEWLTDPKHDDCYNAEYYGGQYDPRLDKLIAFDWNSNKEFNRVVNNLADFICKMPSAKREAA